MLKPVNRIKGFIPGQTLYFRVRGGFVTQGTTITKWCKENNIHPSSARLALLGGWTGPKAKSTCAKLITASGIDSRQHHAA